MLNHIFVEQHSAVHLLMEPYFWFKNIGLETESFQKKLQREAKHSSPSLLS